jgi:hypothetical protein
MRNLYHVITIRGMPVRLHYTWLVLTLLGVWVIGGVIVPAYFLTSSLVVRSILALVILMLCFGTVVVHELALLLVAHCSLHISRTPSHKPAYTPRLRPRCLREVGS